MSAPLRKLQAQMDALRNKLGVSGRGEVIYLAPSDTDDELVIRRVKDKPVWNSDRSI